MAHFEWTTTSSTSIPLIGSRDPRRILSGFYQDSLLIKSPKKLLILSGRRHLGRHLGRRRSNFRSITAEDFLQSTREISRPYCSQQDRCLFDVDERLCSERMCSERSACAQSAVDCPQISFLSFTFSLNIRVIWALALFVSLSSLLSLNYL